MSKNTGKSTESDFEDILRSMGKKAYFHRLVDASTIHGLTGKSGQAPPQPSDYVAVIDGITQFAEVKSTQNISSFPFSLLRTKQSAAAKQVLAAGGDYFVYVKSIMRGKWYRLDYKRIELYKNTLDEQSIKWDEMPPWEF